MIVCMYMCVSVDVLYYIIIFRFAQLFICPMLLKDCLEKEIEAVDNGI